MTDAGQSNSRMNGRRKALFYVLAYLIVSAVWIIFSGSVLDLLVGNAAIRGQLEIFKGLFYIGAMSVALYLLLRSWQSDASDSFAQAGERNIGRATWRLSVAYLLVMVIAVACGGYVVFENVKRSESRKIEQNLAAIATLKAEQIDGWLKQSMNYAHVSGNGSHLASRFDEWSRTGWRKGADEQWIRVRLAALRQSFPYGDLALVDRDGVMRMSTGGSPLEADHLRTEIQQAIALKKPVAGKIHWHEQHDGGRRTSLHVIAPLLPAGVGGPVSGLLLLEMNPDLNLFPLIHLWPTDSTSAETVVFRRDGDELQFFGELRHRKGEAMKTYSIAQNPQMLAAKVLSGDLGIVYGNDYRDVPVLGYAIGIPGTDWSMVAKVDQDEIFKPLQQAASSITMTALLLMMVGALSLYFWWRQKRAQYQTANLQAELRQQALDRHYALLSKYANDIILLMDENGVIVEANDRAEIAYGYSREKLIGSHIHILRVQDDWLAMNEQWQQMVLHGNILFEGRHVRSDGSVFPVEVSTRSIKTENGVFVQSIVRDISERKAQEARELLLTKTLRALSVINGAIMRLEDEAPLLLQVCDTAVELGGMALAWVGGVDSAKERIVPLAMAGKATAYLDEIVVLLADGAVESKGPVGTTYREKRIVVNNDFQHAESAAPWREKAIRYGLNSVATFPIIRAGGVYAVLAVYSEAVQAFDEEVVNLLADMARGISFALDNFDRETSRRQAEMALRQSEARFRMVAELAPFPLQIRADDGEILLLNRAWTESTGYTIEDIPTMSAWIEKACARQASLAKDSSQIVFGSGGKWISNEYAVLCKDGSQRIWYFVSTPLTVLDDGRQTAISMAVDVTDSKKAEEELRLAAKVFESSHSGIMITDVSPTIVAVNPAFSHITGYAADEAIGRNPRFLHSGRQGHDFYQSFWSALVRDGRWQGELWNRRKNGEEYAMWFSVSALRDEKGITQYYIGIADDITESKENQSRIEFLAYHDALTGLPNRMLANDRLEQAIAHAHRTRTRVAVMFLDLDDFKTINDTLGHSAGDVMLKAVADRLRQCVRDSDTVSRQGGDEFLVMLTDVGDLDAINSVAIDILAQIGKPFRVENHDLSTSTSIGIAIYPEDGLNCDTLLKNADMAMYNAKQSGRNTHRFFAEDMNDYVLEHLLIRNGLTHALENGEFRLHYQPQLELATGRLIGAEALIRWQHPELGMVPPNRFIQVAEESGMIIPIGVWVLQEACRQAKAWQTAGWPELVVGVNISAIQFRRGDLEQIVSSALTESGLAPQFLELELTESILIQDVDKSLDMIQRLKNLGVRLSIDDFGTGYSSLAYLRQLPVDKLKIDQSFVREIVSRKDDAAIALSIITLAHTLQKRVIAEGVETMEQFSFMREHCCDEIQGYLFSRPMAPDAFMDFLQQDVRPEFLP
ncbi:MAG: hypothetical protein H6R04_2127 [Burkholderiaceae bacterium]|nr:hypothetical protein [Burkholderiaceae bacterium]